MNIEDRRQFLKMLGIAAPAGMAIDAPPTPRFKPSPASPEEVFTLYVSEALRFLPDYMAKDSSSIVRMLVEANGFALAAVLARLQGHGDD